MDSEASHQPNFRTRWTPSINKIFADLVVKYIQLLKEQISSSC